MSGSRRSLVLRAALAGVALGWGTLCAAPAKPSAGKESPPAEVTLSLQLAPESWTIPKAGQPAEGVITLRIANGTDKGHWFNVLGSVTFVLKDGTGTAIRARAGRHNAETPEPVRIEAGRARDLGYSVMLKRSPDQGTVALSVSDLCGGFWDYADLAPGSYTLEADYVNLKPRLGGRVHAITSEKGFSTRTLLWVGRLSAGPAKLLLNPEEPPKRDENTGERPAGDCPSSTEVVKPFYDELPAGAPEDDVQSPSEVAPPLKRAIGQVCLPPKKFACRPRSFP